MDTQGCCSSGFAAHASHQIRGSCQQIGGLEVYCVAPEDKSGIPKILMLLPDGFGLAMHNRILADKFAGLGWHAFLPDYFEGDPLPEGLLGANPTVIFGETERAATSEAPAVINLQAWLEKHSHDRVEDLLHELVEDLQVMSPVAEIYGAGYCFGGKHVLRLAKTCLQAAVAFHPSFVECVDCKGIQAPLYIGLAGDDQMVPPTLQHDLSTWLLQSPQTDFVIETYDAMPHGFAARPNDEDSAVKASCGRAFAKAVSFLQKREQDPKKSAQ